MGFRPERGDGIPDHLAAEFEFLGALAEREASLRAGRSTPRSVGPGDLCALQSRAPSRLGWLDDFDEAVRESDAAEGVFAALARFARTFAAWGARELARAQERSTSVDSAPGSEASEARTSEN